MVSAWTIFFKESIVGLAGNIDPGIDVEFDDEQNDSSHVREPWPLNILNYRKDKRTIDSRRMYTSHGLWELDHRQDTWFSSKLKLPNKR